MLNKDCIRVLNLCDDSTVINAPFMLGLWGSPSYHRVVLVLSVSLVSSAFLPFCAQKQVPWSCRMQPPCVPPCTAQMKQSGTTEHFVYPRRKSTLNGFQNMHVLITSSCVREGELFTKYVQVNASAHVHTPARKRWPPHLFHIRKCFHVLIRKY